MRGIRTTGQERSNTPWRWPRAPAGSRAGRTGGPPVGAVPALVLSIALVFRLGAQTPDADGSSTAGYFSAPQVERGADGYREHCSECHTTSQLKGPDFEWRWRRQTAWELYREISTTMPETDPGALAAETYVAIVAYVLSLNDYQEGGDDLAPTEEALSSIALGAGAAKAPETP